LEHHPFLGGIGQSSFDTRARIVECKVESEERSTTSMSCSESDASGKTATIPMDMVEEIADESAIKFDPSSFMLQGVEVYDDDVAEGDSKRMKAL
jgi:hypothetical protein